MKVVAELKLSQRVVLTSAALALSALIYLLANRVSLRAPSLLPLTSLDMAVPFVPETVWVYVSHYLAIAGAFLLSRTWPDARRFATAYLALGVGAALVHLCWPTTFPRGRYPLSGEGLTVATFRLLREVDLPTSCLPSMHVAGSVLAALSLWQSHRRLAYVWLVWAAAIGASTLTAKQHYVIDIAAGAVSAGLAWFAFYRVLARQSIKEAGDEHRC